MVPSNLPDFKNLGIWKDHVIMHWVDFSPLSPYHFHMLFEAHVGLGILQIEDEPS